jgi:hypothetical protein
MALTAAGVVVVGSGAMAAFGMEPVYGVLAAAGAVLALGLENRRLRRAA